MEKEVDVSKCRGCEKLKIRVQKGTFDGRNKRFVDLDDRLWNGRRCPDCHKNKVKIQTKEKRSNADSKPDV